jgi:hypothetical protein
MVLVHCVHGDRSVLPAWLATTTYCPAMTNRTACWLLTNHTALPMTNRTGCRRGYRSGAALRKAALPALLLTNSTTDAICTACRRGYRSGAAVHKAALNEAAAAGLLLLAGWHERCQQEGEAAQPRCPLSYAESNTAV